MRNRIIQATVLLVALAVTAFGRCFAQITAQSTDSSAQTSQSSTQDNSQQTLDGCLVREEHAVYLMPASGDKTQLSAGGQDLNSHMGEEVRLSGNQGGSQASQSSASSSSAGSSTGDDNKFVVTKVDVVAHTCPAEIQNRIDQDKKKSK
jgi:FlaG/FlaF family flagellin (archaellin)